MMDTGIRYGLKLKNSQDSNLKFQIMHPYKKYVRSRSLYDNCQFTKMIVILLNIFVIVAWSFALYLNLLCGDIQMNPGPNSSVTDFSDVSDARSYLKIFHLNIQSICPKLDLLQSEMQTYDVLIFTETWLSPDIPDKDVEIINFSPPYRKDRERRGGGVAMYLKDSIFHKRRSDLEIRDLESLWVQVEVSGKKMLINGSYRPPSSSRNYWDLIDVSFSNGIDTGIDNIFILGDFNNDCLNKHNNEILDICNQYNLTQLIEEPTHYTETSSTLLDLAIVKNVNSIVSACVGDPFIPDLIRYHCPIVISVDFKKPQICKFKRRIWKYDDGDYELYRNLLEEYDWDNLLADGEVDDNAEKITKQIIDIASQSIPNKLATIRPAEPDCMHNEIRKLIRQRKRLHRKAKLSNTTENWTKFRQKRNEVVSAIRKSKVKYYEKISDQLKQNKGAKTWWRTAKKAMGGNMANSIPPLHYNNILAESDLDKAEVLNEYFTSQSSLNDRNKQLPNMIDVANDILYDINITQEDVENVLKELDPSKATGPDLMNPKLLKEGAEQLSNPLSKLFNKSVVTGKYPSLWKKANIIPIFKKGDKNSPSNYRPVSLLCCLGKVMEKCIYKYIYNFLLRNSLLSPFQSGFRQGDSTTNQLLYIYNFFCSAIDDGKDVRAVFCDVSKAFDKVWHRGLLYKLNKIGVRGKVYVWLCNYLNNRKQRVVINGHSSSWKSVNAGVPQGSILGPLLFLIFINDIVANIDSNIRLFADDTSLYILVENPYAAATCLNKDLSKILKWAEDWLVLFNPSKTEDMIISRKLTRDDHPDIVFNNTVIPQVESHKHLGIHLSNNCQWNEHIKFVLDKSWQKLNILRSLKFKVDRLSLQQMYFSFIRPLLEYSDVVWDNCSRQQKNLLESVQLEAARIVTGATKLTSFNNLYIETGWEKLELRREKHKLIVLYKMINGLVPNYLEELLPPLVQETARYNLRNDLDFRTILTRTKLYYDSVLPSAIRAWNNLSDDVRNLPTLSSFRKAINYDKLKVPSYYSVGSRMGQILHTRLRLGCSALNGHLFSKNLVSNPSCLCGDIETTHHYLLKCNRYTNERDLHLSNLNCQLSTNNLLYGVNDYTDKQNEHIFLCVQAYILATNRFQ